MSLFFGGAAPHEARHWSHWSGALPAMNVWLSNRGEVVVRRLISALLLSAVAALPADIPRRR
jgi:hypothetical protein